MVSYLMYCYQTHRAKPMRLLSKIGCVVMLVRWVLMLVGCD